MTRGLLLALVWLASGCWGPISGAREPRSPGAAPVLDTGAIAVDDRSDMAFVVSASGKRRRLLAIGAETSPRTAADLHGRRNVMLAFAVEGLLLISTYDVSEPDPAEAGSSRKVSKTRFDLLGRGSFRSLRKLELAGGRSIASSDGKQVAHVSDGEMTLVRSLDLQTVRLPIRPTDLAFLKQKAGFVALECGNHEARLSSWRIDEDGAARREGNVSLDEDCGDFGTLVVDHAERHAAFTIRQRGLPETVILVDLSDHTTRRIRDTRGPVAFSVDDSRLVGWRGDPGLVLVDVATLRETTNRVSMDVSIGYYTPPTPAVIVIGNGLGYGTAQRMLVYDLQRNVAQRMPGPGVALREFVERQAAEELWLVDHEALFRLDVKTPTLEHVPTDFAPRHINRLSRRDWLVLDDAYARRLSFYDPKARRVVREARF